jgi:FtsH-binding integral membrane protein
LVLVVGLVSTAIVLRGVVLFALSRWPQYRRFFIRNIVLGWFLEFVPLGLLLFLSWLLRSNLVGNLLLLVAIDLLLVRTTFTIVLSSEDVELLVSTGEM